MCANIFLRLLTCDFVTGTGKGTLWIFHFIFRQRAPTYRFSSHRIISFIEYVIPMKYSLRTLVVGTMVTDGSMPLRTLKSFDNENIVFVFVVHIKSTFAGRNGSFQI